MFAATIGRPRGYPDPGYLDTGPVTWAKESHAGPAINDRGHIDPGSRGFRAWPISLFSRRATGISRASHRHLPAPPVRSENFAASDRTDARIAPILSLATP